jgi:hypothetical protein
MFLTVREIGYFFDFEENLSLFIDISPPPVAIGKEHDK